MIWDIIFLVVVVAVVVVFLRVVRPRLRAARHRRWQRDGLMPEQVDPYAPRAQSPSDPEDRTRG